MTDINAASDLENQMVDELMAEGFGDPLPPRQEPMLINRVTVANQVCVASVPSNEPSGEVLEEIPFQVEALEPPSSDFILWRCQLNDYAATFCTERPLG